MALAAILAAKAEVLLSIRIGSQHAGRAQSWWALFWISRFIHFGVWLDFFFFLGAAIAATIPFS